MATDNLPPTDQEILDRLERELSVEDWARLRRGLALLDDDCPETVRAVEPDPQKMTVANWPSND